MQYSPDILVVGAAELLNDLRHLLVGPGADEDLGHAVGNKKRVDRKVTTTVLLLFYVTRGIWPRSNKNN